MGNQYDLLVKKTPNLVEWDTLDIHPDIEYMQAEIDGKNTVTVNASGAVSAGQVVAFNVDGTVSAVYKDADTAVDPVSGATELDLSFGFFNIKNNTLDDTVWVQCVELTWYPNITVVSLSGAGDEVNFIDNSRIHGDTTLQYFAQAYHETEERMITVFSSASVTKISSLWLSGGSIASEVQYDSYAGIQSISMVYDSTNNKILMSYLKGFVT